MRHTNATSALCPCIDRHAACAAQQSRFVGGDHVKSIDPVEPVFGTTAQQCSGLRLAGVGVYRDKATRFDSVNGNKNRGSQSIHGV
jgi:hypothetical protein